MINKSAQARVREALPYSEGGAKLRVPGGVVEQLHGPRGFKRVSSFMPVRTWTQSSTCLTSSLHRDGTSQSRTV